MDWSNDRILELIQNYESEPVLWKRQPLDHKRKQLNHDAWVRIKNNLSWTVTVEELKAKMKSLMAYYRINMHKNKKSLKSGTATDEVVQTSWFAYEAMNRFLAPVYESQSSISTPEIKKENETRKEAKIIDTADNSNPRPKSSVRKKLKDKLPSDIIEAKQQMHVACQNMIRTSLDDDYDIFGKLIANEIRKLKDHNGREIVMNDIFKLVIQASMH